MWNPNILGKKREYFFEGESIRNKNYFKKCEFSFKERNQSGSHKDTALTTLIKWKRFREKTSQFS